MAIKQSDPPSSAAMSSAASSSAAASASAAPSSSAASAQASGADHRDIPVDWEALEDAFENNAPEVHSYLHLSTGDVLRVVDGVADPQMHSRIAVDNGYLRVEPVSSREQYRGMERYIQMIDPSELRDALGAAIDGKGAFRRFKDVLMSHATERERWFAFRSERLRVFMEAWLDAHALRAIPRQDSAAPPPHVQNLDPSALVAPVVVPVESSLPPRSRAPGVEALRRQLKEVAGTLGARDLDKVLTFAEFVRARRASRSAFHDKDGDGQVESDSDAGDERPAHASGERR
jgi:uncharacterized protein UPF0158